MAMSVRVKICGITSLADAEAAIQAGADALGFVFCEASPRCLSTQSAALICADLPPFVVKVGLFVNPTQSIMAETLNACRIDVVQLHGDESPEFCSAVPRPVIKAFRIRDKSSLKELAAYPGATWLLDSYVAGKLGGTGEQFNWELARRAVQSSSRIILAGGLTPANVATAVRQVRPYAVDVSSGVESAPGRKDRQKLEDFVRAAKEA